MNPKPSPENDQPLRKLLRQWQVDASLPPRFQEHVWAQIASEETPVAPGLWVVMQNWMARRLVRPAFMVSYLAVLFLIGATAGHQQGQIKTEQAKSELQTRYLQMVDPYQAHR